MLALQAWGAAPGKAPNLRPWRDGIRHEDTVVVTENGCENLGPKWPGTPEEPAVV